MRNITSSTRSSTRRPTTTSPTRARSSRADSDSERSADRRRIAALRRRSRRQRWPPRRPSGNRAWLADAAAQGLPKEILTISTSGRQADQAQPRLCAAFPLDRAELKPVRDKIAALEKSKPAIPTVPVMVELPADHRRVTRILRKGNFLDPGDAVETGRAAVVASLARRSAQEPARAGAVAGRSTEPPDGHEWPSTATGPRSSASGLVETEEDFGTQGEPPSHPELLDWLAVQYRESGWDTKSLLRLIVTSATYRQSSKVRPELLEKDPRNRLLARAPRVRLEAEMVRDQALALSGLLSRKVGGPSVFPPQPDGLWQAAFNGERTWSTSQGEDRYRRGLYTFWRRTVPYPSMATFDAPSREICAIRRVRTNTPLQSFVTLNDPVYVEAAQALARRIVREGGTNVAARVRYGLQLCLCRPPRPEQVEPLVALYTSGIRAIPQGPRRPPRPWPPTRSGRFRPAWNRPSWPPGPRSPTCS